MKNQELFDRTVGILVKAYFNNTLEHGDCCACAVGNLVCANMYNGDVRAWDNDYYGYFNENWSDVFMTTNCNQNVKVEKLHGRAYEQIKSTGYDFMELAKIEFAFETVKIPVGEFGEEENSDEHIFNGLMAVVEVLSEIHEATNEEITQAKSLFKKELAEVG